MEIATKEFKHVLLLAVKGRVDSVEAAHLEEALERANRRGNYRLVIDMSQLEYMSSAGFRALAAAKRNSKHHKRGELVLTQVPDGVREALDLVGFTEYFKIIDPPESAVQYIENVPEDVSDASSDT